LSLSLRRRGPNAPGAGNQRANTEVRGKTAQTVRPYAEDPQLERAREQCRGDPDRHSRGLLWGRRGHRCRGARRSFRATSVSKHVGCPKPSPRMRAEDEVPSSRRPGQTGAPTPCYPRIVPRRLGHATSPAGWHHVVELRQLRMEAVVWDRTNNGFLERAMKPVVLRSASGVRRGETARDGTEVR
jgi:hypothetical protein